MYASGRSRRRLREAAILPGQGHAATANDQQASGNGRKTLHLRVPHPPSPVAQYYPGTSIPMSGWFHACKLCRCWTAFCAFDTSGMGAPLCRRCASHHHTDIRLIRTFESDTAATQAVSNATVKPCPTAAHELLAPAAAAASLDDVRQSPRSCFAASFLSTGFAGPVSYGGSAVSQQSHMQQHVRKHQYMPTHLLAAQRTQTV